jgi:drug/metabolite transporter (DMT)-like permease
MSNAGLSSETSGKSGMRRSASLGRLYGLIAATFLGVNTTFARLAYDGGSNPFTVVGSRFLFCAIAVAVTIRLVRRTYVIPRRTRLLTLGVTVVWFLTTTSYLSSVLFIPVSLAALVFYTFPLMVVGLSPLMERARFGPARVGAFLLAFAGLAIALSPSFHSLDWRGIALAFLAAIGAAITLILSKRLVSEQGVFTFTLYMSTGSVLLITGIMQIGGGIALPQDATGWIGLSGATVGFVVGILTMFSAIQYVGPSPTSLIMNLEPLISILAAAVVLGERLTVLQFVGAVMVISALILSVRAGADQF